jgi:hypothetical protein
MRAIEIHGYAIVSDDDMIADASDQVPVSLRNAADWEQYQAAQARSALVVFARVSHQFEPNTRGDPRLVVSRSAKGLEKREDAWWWSPAAVPWLEVAAKLLPNGGEVAACGGQGVFDLFLGVGYDVFHLAHARGVKLPGGRKVFSGCEAGVTAEAALQKRGLRHAERIELDAAQGVEMNIWRKG